MEKDSEKKYRQLTCPVCGKSFPIRITSLHGSIELSVKCRGCKSVSEVKLTDI